MTADHLTIDSNRLIRPAKKDENTNPPRHLSDLLARLAFNLRKQLWRHAEDQSKMSTSSFEGIL